MRKRSRKWRNRMQESCSYGSVGERGGNEPLYPERVQTFNLELKPEAWLPFQLAVEVK